MATEPKIIVTEESLNASSQNNISPSNVAIIGAFDSEVSTLTLCKTAYEAHAIFGTTSTAGTFKGTDNIDYLFMGASSVLFVNITTWSDDSTPVASTTLTTEKLNAALALLHNEVFSMLFIAEELTDAQQVIVSSWLNAEFEGKYCHGQVAQLTKSTVADYTTSVEKFDNNVYYINTQTLTVNGTSLDLNRSTAYIAGLIAGLPTDSSLTSKVISGVTSVSPEYSTVTGQLGAALLNLNIPFIACRNRRLQTYYCVNSMLPDGYDLYINRVRDEILNNIAVEVYLGEKNNLKTENGIITLMEGIKRYYVNDLEYLSDITYHVEKTNSKCSDLIIDTMVFDDILTTINIKYSIEVQ